MSAEFIGVKKSWLNVQEAAFYLGVSKSLLDKDRCSWMLGIPYAKVGSKILYSIKELDLFLEGRTVRQNSEKV